MSRDGLEMTAENVRELQQAFQEAPWYAERFIRGSMGRFARRVRRRTLQQMSGSPSSKRTNAKPASAPLFGGQFKTGRHVKGMVSGSGLDGLKAINKISAILRTHEEGRVIEAHDGVMYLSRKNGVAGKGAIFARAGRIEIPKRLHFMDAWKEETPRGTQEILDAADRALRLSMEKKMAVLSNYAKRMAAHG